VKIIGIVDLVRAGKEISTHENGSHDEDGYPNQGLIRGGRSAL
jgi:hypothetical protein